MIKSVFSRFPSRILAGGSTILMILFFLSGCQTTTVVPAGTFHLPDDYILSGSGKPVTIYSIKTRQMENHLEIKKFGISPDGETDTIVKHGLSYTMYLDPNNTRLFSELRHILTRHGYGSYDAQAIDAFKRAYNGRQNIVPELPYAALPRTLGHDLFSLAQRADDWDVWITMPGMK